MVLTVKKRWLVMIVSTFMCLPLCDLDIFATGKCFNHGGTYGLECRANFHFYGPEKVYKQAKEWSNKDQRKLKRNCNTLSKTYTNFLKQRCYMTSYWTYWLKRIQIYRVLCIGT